MHARATSHMRTCLWLRIPTVFFHTEEELYARNVYVFLTIYDILWHLF